jgi:Tfp pilus assembly protein PilX
MTRAREEQGVALVAAIMLMMAMMGLGLALLKFANSQQKGSTREQASEAAFNVAEAALNAQVGQLARQWPVSKEEAESPKSCTALTKSSASSDCPSTSDLSSDPNTGSATCSGTDAWGSSLSNQWTTYVREPESEVVGSSPVAKPLFNSATEQTKPSYDGEGLGKLWVRSVGVVQCHAVALVTLVSRLTVALNFPENAVTGNWFKVTNEGKKTIINRQGTAGEEETQAGAVSMRCSGFTGTPEEIEKQCEQWNEKKEQIKPALTENPTSPSTTLTATQMESLKKEAQEHNTYYSATAPYHCPSGLTELTGKPVYIEGCGALKLQANGTANTATSPGFLVVANGTFALGGTCTFYGIIYAANLENLSGTVVELFGNTTVVGAIDVDGNGGIEFGSSGAKGYEGANLEYSSTAFRNLSISAGAAATRNSFRILPAGQ